MLVERWIGAPLCALALAAAMAAQGCADQGAGTDSSDVGLSSCQMGQTLPCVCAGQASQVQTCQPNGTFSTCPCNAAGGQGGAAAGMGPAPGGSGGTQANAGASGQGLGGRGGAGGSIVGVGGAAGRGGAGGGGAGGSGGGGAGGAMTAGGGGSVAPGDDPFAVERQACVDEINMYRMSIGRMPLVRGTAEQETCSDAGSKQDGDSGRAHGSAGSCRGLGAQNTCPGYSLRVGGGTLTGALKYCLKQMWDEGEPAEGVQACTADINGCFQDHGHWINMQSTSAARVACGFYKMANGSYWMNQNFGR